jgi:hypothetical protein
MRSVETISGMGVKGINDNGGRSYSSVMIYLTYCKKLCKCHNAPHASQQLKKKRSQE